MSGVLALIALTVTALTWIALLATKHRLDAIEQRIEALERLK